MTTVSLWLDTPYTPCPSLSRDIAVPVAIIGGGITGISTAYWLSRHGLPSAVLERHTVASGATGRNAGFLLEGTVPDYPELVAAWGRATARALWDFTSENRRRVQDVCALEGISCDLMSCGSIVAAASETELAALTLHAEMLAQDGYACDILDRRAVLEELSGAGAFVGGLRNPRDNGLHPVRFVRGLQHAAERGSAATFEATTIRAIEPNGTTWKILTPSGTVRADQVVLSLNAYTSLVDPTWTKIIQPVRGQVLATGPVGPRLFRHLFYANEGFEYWRQLPGGQILLGGLRHLAMQDEVGTRDVLHTPIQDALERYLRDLGVPSAIPVRHRWSGIMGFTPDRLPLIGPVPGRDGLLIAGGYSGHGLAFAFLAGRMIAQLVATGATEYPHVLFPQRLLRP